MSSKNVFIYQNNPFYFNLESNSFINYEMLNLLRTFWLSFFKTKIKERYQLNKEYQLRLLNTSKDVYINNNNTQIQSFFLSPNQSFIFFKEFINKERNNNNNNLLPSVKINPFSKLLLFIKDNQFRVLVFFKFVIFSIWIHFPSYLRYW